LGSKINLKARIKRHSRVLKSRFSWKNKKSWKSYYGYNIVIFIAIFLVPVYPTFASLVYNNSVLEFYRGDIDESSILSSYFWWNDVLWEWDLIAESKDSFLLVNTSLWDERNLSWTNEIINYEVKPWDNISKIASKFWISIDSIYWANNFTKNKIIHPWNIIKIPPVTGIIHKIKSWDTISFLAKKYNIEENKIIRQNLLSALWELKIGDSLVIPWAKKIEPPKPKVVIPTKKITTVVANNTTTIQAKTVTKKTVTELASKYLESGEKWIYKLVRRKPKHVFYRGNCTWYVGQYKNVNWWWNAKDWLKNAQKFWHSTWVNPWVWAIVVFNGKWYNPRYWHVAIVMDVKKDYIYISDMNYRKLWEITYRKVPKRNRAIIWYIYVD
jgi:surface antigen/LysM repeat protein